jgi:hypothetical protein
MTSEPPSIDLKRKVITVFGFLKSDVEFDCFRLVPNLIYTYYLDKSGRTFLDVSFDNEPGTGRLRNKVKRRKMLTEALKTVI